MRYPRSLNKQGTIGFVAPAFGCNIEPYRTAFQNAQSVLKQQGYSLKLGPNCYAGKGIGISNTPEACAAEFMESGADPDSDVLISCGGGE
ncbi:MAG: LD-carboxypeptidase, partial [Lachnospiraceae bacterium]|nr:LD-carboxypeptidase [Lachnospiraceae bacterium]